MVSMAENKQIHPENNPSHKPFWVDNRYTGAIEYYREKTARTTKCRICELQILKGETRVRAVQRLRPGSVQKGLRGGTIFKDVRFYHPNCLHRLFGGVRGSTATAPWTVCYLCKARVTRSVPRPSPTSAGNYTPANEEFAGYHRTRVGSVPVCKSCVARLFSCDCCSMYVEGARITPRIPLHVDVTSKSLAHKSSYYCYTCVDKYELKDCLRWQKREERAAKKLQKEFEEIKENLRKNGV